MSRRLVPIIPTAHQPGSFLNVDAGGSVPLLCKVLGPVDRCRGCDAPILWVLTPNAGKMPADLPEDDVDAAISHWRTCPEAAAFHGKTRAQFEQEKLL